MSISRIIAAVVLGALTPLAAAQEAGQYRSRILLDPLDEIGKGSEMSIGELEQSINTISDPYARSSATRHLARHYVNQGDYPAAISWYRQALQAGGLSDVANREMLRELAQVYLQAQRYGEAVDALEGVLAIKLGPAASDYLLLAQAHYRLGDYVAVVVALDSIAAAGLALDTAQKRQALALYYRAGAFEQCETLLQALLKADPAQAEYWHQLVSVYLQQNKRRQALDQLMLGMEKGISFDVSQYTLLVDLIAVNGNPYGAAALLEQLMAGGQLPRDGDNQRKAFELWFQARERERAMAALARAARLTGDTELYLYLAQLQIEDEAWPAAEQSVLAACEARLQDSYVSRANLLLGISLIKQGRREAARQVLINATLIGGANQQAAQWLRFMDTRPATDDELRRVAGPCIGSEGKRVALRQAPAADPVTPAAAPAAVTEVPAPAGPTLEVQRAAPQRYFFAAYDEPLETLLPRVQSLAVRQSVSMIKAGGSAAGTPRLLTHGGEQGLGIPLRGSAQARGRFRVFNVQAFSFVAFPVDPGQAPQSQFEQAAQQLRAADLRPSGDWRLVPGEGPEGQAVLQLGVMVADDRREDNL